MMDAREIYQPLIQIDGIVESARRRLVRLRRIMHQEEHDVFISYIIDTEDQIEQALKVIKEVKKQIEEQNDN